MSTNNHSSSSDEYLSEHHVITDVTSLTYKKKENFSLELIFLIEIYLSRYFTYVNLAIEKTHFCAQWEQFSTRSISSATGGTTSTAPIVPPIMTWTKKCTKIQFLSLKQKYWWQQRRHYHGAHRIWIRRDLLRAKAGEISLLYHQENRYSIGCGSRSSSKRQNTLKRV